jgi:hypothetical protein
MNQHFRSLLPTTQYHDYNNDTFTMAENDKEASVIEDALRSKDEKYSLRKNSAGKSEVWKQFYLVFVTEKETTRAVPDMCAYVRCKKVYRLGNGKTSFGTKNLSDHMKLCNAEKPQTSNADITKIFRKTEVC